MAEGVRCISWYRLGGKLCGRRTNPTLSVALLLVLAGWPQLIGAVTVGPDAFGYVAADQYEPGVTYSWVDMSPGSVLLLGDDETSASIPIGFPFRFYGETFDDVFVNSNGMLWFWSQGVASFTGTQCPLPVQDLVDAGIAFYQRDFNPESPDCVNDCRILVASGGVAPARWFGVTFASMPRSGDPPDPVTVQVILFEGSNEIKVQVGDSGVSSGGDATIGIEGRGGWSGLSYPGCLTVGSVADETAVVFTPPDAGLVIVPPLSTAWALPGQQVAHSFLAVNNGAQQVEVDLFAVENVWPTALSAATLVLGPGESTGFDAEVEIPSGAEGGERDQAIIVVQPQSGDPLTTETQTLVQDPYEQWQELPWPVPLPVFDSVAAALGSDLWLAGGLIYDPLTSAVYLVDYLQVLHTIDWSWEHSDAAHGGTLPPLPTPLGRAAGCALGGKIYLTGGLTFYNESLVASADVHVYDVATAAWSTTTPMPEGRSNHVAVCVPSDGKIFVIGGYGPFDPQGDQSPTGTVWSYNVASDTWDASPTDLDDTLVDSSGQLLAPDAILVAGGEYGGMYFQRSYLYDIPTNTWVPTRDLPTGRIFHSSALLEDGRMCVIGGTSLPFPAEATNTYACYSQGWWIPQVSVLGTPRTRCGATTLEGRMYVVGGATTHDPASVDFVVIGSTERYPWDPIDPGELIFTDGFESGDSTMWSGTVG